MLRLALSSTSSLAYKLVAAVDAFSCYGVVEPHGDDYNYHQSLHVQKFPYPTNQHLETFRARVRAGSGSVVAIGRLGDSSPSVRNSDRWQLLDVG